MQDRGQYGCTLREIRARASRRAVLPSRSVYRALTYLVRAMRVLLCRVGVRDRVYRTVYIQLWFAQLYLRLRARVEARA